MLIFAVHMLPFFSYDIPEVEKPPESNRGSKKSYIPSSQSNEVSGEDKYNYYYYRPTDESDSTNLRSSDQDTKKSVERVKATSSSVPNLSSQKEEAAEGLERYKNYVYDSENEEKTASSSYTAGNKDLATQKKSFFNLTEYELEEDKHMQLLFRTFDMESILTDVTPEHILRDMTTPQGKAFDWIARQDPLELDADDLLAQQRYVLAVLYFALKGPNWHYGKKSWLSKNKECDWNDDTFDGGKVGVFKCDSDGYIIHIQLVGNNLVGELPPEIGYLPRLQHLDLENNRIEGTIPSELGKMVRLETLGLSSNKLTGTIPTELGRIQRMGQFMVNFNDLSGSMPAEICALTPHTEDGGLLFNLWADCGTLGGLECECCDECCDGLNTCRSVKHGPSANSYSYVGTKMEADGVKTFVNDDDDDDYARMFAEEAEMYFDEYGY